MVRLVCQEYQGLETFVLDTRNISFGSGVFALLAAHWIADGMDWQTLQNRLVERLGDSKVFFCVDTLEYLRKGGRLGLVAAAVGTALRLKPIISCNESGVYYIVGKALGRGKSLDRMLELASTFAASRKGSQVALLNGDAQEEAGALRPRLLEKPDAPVSWRKARSAQPWWYTPVRGFWGSVSCGAAWMGDGIAPE